jgi:hypothetical protein
MSLLVLTVLIVQWRALNFLSGTPLSSDRGQFASVGWVWNQGLLPYRDAWDHKPPGITFYSSWALAWLDSDSARAIWRLQWLHSVVLLSLVGLVVRLLFRSWPVAIAAAWFTHLLFYHQSLYLGGHYSTEYGVTYVLLAFGGLAVLGRLLASGYSPQGPLSFGLVAGSGFLASLATLFKEPFLLDSVPLFLWALAMVGKTPRDRWVCFGLFVGGALVPYFLVAGYFLLRGGLLDWLSAYGYNFAYRAEQARLNPSEDSQLFRSWGRVWTLFVRPAPTLTVLAALGAVCAAFPSLSRTPRGATYVLLGWLLTAFLGASLSAGLFHHYYLQMAVPLVLLAALGMAAFLQLSRRFALPPALILLPIVLGIIYLEIPPRTTAPGTSDAVVFHSLRRHQFHLVQRPLEEADRFILDRTKDEDFIWAQCFKNSGIYAELKRRPASSYLFVLEFLFINSPGWPRQAKLEQLRADLEQNAPSILVLEEGALETAAFLRDSGVKDWIETNYVPSGFKRLGSPVWVRKR